MLIYQKLQKHHTIGGKAQGLFQLKRAGLQVPDFIVLPFEAFEPENFTISTEDQAAVQKILKTWDFPQKCVVVRSSVADEDGKQHAFAGMMDSFLHLRTIESVLQAITACAQSARSERVMAYRHQKGLSLDAKPAVIIQKQIEAVYSGVLFTTFPEYPQEIAIHTVAGFGDELMQGHTVADEYYLWKKNGEMNRKIINQLATTQGILSQIQLTNLYEVACKIENHFGSPQDVEFVFDPDDLYIVQARPITQIIPPITIYDNSNIQESYCGVTTPLTFSFAQRAYATVYRQTMKNLGLSAYTIAENESVIQNLLGLVQGRIYYNINNWYRGMQLLPSFKQNKADMERMMGLTEPVDFVETRTKTFWQKCRLFPAIILNLVRLLWAFVRLPNRIDMFIKHIQGFYAQFYQNDFASMRFDELLKQKEILDKALLQNWSTPIINDFFVMMSNGRVVRSLQKIGITDSETFLSQYLSGNQQLAGTLPTRSLQVLAKEAEKNTVLKNLIIALPLDIHSKIQSNFEDFYIKVMAFLSNYGDRTVGELKLETRTMRIEPVIFYKYLKNFLTTSVSETQSSNSLHQIALATLSDKLSNKSSLIRSSTFKKLATLQRAIAHREILRLERTRLFGMYRTVYRALGELFVKNTVLESVEDVFYLTEEEIIQGNTVDFKALVKERKPAFDTYQVIQVDSRVITPYPPTSAIITEENPDYLYGTGCVPGRVQGEIIVITDPTQDLNVAGKIVCAIRTDPGWAALFPTCKAVLIEKGSSLSHSVILLRELGIPTIINIPQLTQRLQTGQSVAIDAMEGKIYLKNEA